MSTERFPFDFDPRYRVASRAFGVTPETAYVHLDDERLVARFGPWIVDTPRTNVQGAGVTGPYSVIKTIGAAHLSLADRGLTFASNPRLGVCLSFREPVTGLDPLGLVRHPGLTVTVADPAALVASLTDGEPVLRTDVERQAAEQEAVDRLHTLTARELRALADELGVSHTSSTSKRELVDRIEPAAADDLVDLLARSEAVDARST